MVTQEEGLRKGQQVGLWEIALIMLDALLTPSMDGQGHGGLDCESEEG